MNTVTISEISVLDRTRAATVITPSGSKKTFGLGAVGEPLLPYLEVRAGDYDLVLAQEVAVRVVDMRSAPLKSGKLRSYRATLDDLRAPDLGVE